MDQKKKKKNIYCETDISLKNTVICDINFWSDRPARLVGFWICDVTKHMFCLILKSLIISYPHLEPRSTLEAPDTLGICRLAVADSFKAEDGTLPRVRGMWRPARLVAVGTLRQMLLPMRT